MPHPACSWRHHLKAPAAPRACCPLQAQIEELEQRYQAAHRDYLNQTEHRLATFRQLSKNDAAAAKVIEQRMKKLLHLQASCPERCCVGCCLLRLGDSGGSTRILSRPRGIMLCRPSSNGGTPPALPQESLQQWRGKIAAAAREWEERNRALRAEKEIMTRHYAQLKAAMDQGRAQQVRAGQ